jgi:hypothetical protein
VWRRRGSGSAREHTAVRVHRPDGPVPMVRMVVECGDQDGDQLIQLRAGRKSAPETLLSRVPAQVRHASLTARTPGPAQGPTGPEWTSPVLRQWE